MAGSQGLSKAGIAVMEGSELGWINASGSMHYVGHAAQRVHSAEPSAGAAALRVHGVFFLLRVGEAVKMMPSRSRRREPLLLANDPRWPAAADLEPHSKVAPRGHLGPVVDIGRDG